MSRLNKKTFDEPDNKMQPAEKITSEAVEVNDRTLYRVTALPGWRWSVDLKPVANTDSCQMDHLLYMVSGKMVVHMNNGEELEFGPGDVAAIPPGHDGWGLGSNPTIWLEIPH